MGIRGAYYVKTDKRILIQKFRGIPGIRAINGFCQTFRLSFTQFSSISLSESRLKTEIPEQKLLAFFFRRRYRAFCRLQPRRFSYETIYLFGINYIGQQHITYSKGMNHDFIY
jgi:hypothetical protein